MDTIRSVKKLRAVKSDYSYLARLILVLFSLIIVLFLNIGRKKAITYVYIIYYSIHVYN